MKNFSSTQKLTLSAMFLAIGLVLPFFTGQIQQIGNMLCPMHIPVLLCGFICGYKWGAVTGFILPLLRSLLFTMPRMFPNAVCMAVELAVYGLAAGLLYHAFHMKPAISSEVPSAPGKCKSLSKPLHIYIALLGAMVAGRLIWGLVMTVVMGMTGAEFGFAAFWAAAFANAIPGIILQLVLIPAIVLAVEHLWNRQ